MLGSDCPTCRGRARVRFEDRGREKGGLLRNWALQAANLVIGEWWSSALGREVLTDWRVFDLERLVILTIGVDTEKLNGKEATCRLLLKDRNQNPALCLLERGDSSYRQRGEKGDFLQKSRKRTVWGKKTRR